MASFTSLKGFERFSEPSLDERLKTNIPMFFDWGFIDKGAFFNVTRPTTNIYSDDKHKLKLVTDPRFTTGCVWEGTKKNWVWESGVSQTTQPIRVSGVYVNNTFFPSNTSGAYAHYIDYPNGRVIFNTPIATSSNVQLNYSYKYIQFFDGSKVDWVKQIQFNAFKGDSPSNNNRGSGNITTLAEQRIQLPAVAMEISPRTVYKPYAIGTGAQYCYKDIIFYVIADDDRQCAKIADIISLQKEKTIFLYDDELLARSGVQPLNYRGALNSGAKTYPQLVEAVEDGGFRWRKLFFSDSKSSMPSQYGNVWVREVNLTTETVLT